MTKRLALDELSLVQRMVRNATVRVRGAARQLSWALDSAGFPPAHVASPDTELGFEHLWATVERDIARSDAGTDPVLEAGKRHNLALAVPAFDRLVLSPQRPLSFWRTLGPATEERGYVSGMELRGGCVVPAVGGGLCLLSNGLFELAAAGGLEILERWGHTREAAPPDPERPFGLDATVFYPHVDLRFRPHEGQVLVRAELCGARLRLGLYGEHPKTVAVSLRGEDDGVAQGVRSGRLWRDVRSTQPGGPAYSELLANDRREVMSAVERRRSCLSCGLTACAARVEAVLPDQHGGARTPQV